MGSLHPQTQRSSATTELALGVGFLLVAAAVFTARQSPVTGFERSIYAGTPRLTWLCLGLAFVTTVAVGLYRTTDRMRVTALALGGTAMTVLVSLPIIRGYHFLGAADSLTHLGWAKDIAAGVIEPGTLFYPAYHTISVAVSQLAGVSLEQALLLSMVVLFVSFLVFVPLTVWLLTRDTRAMVIAGAIAWMALPVNNVATHMVPHTNTLALFYVPAILCVTIVYLQQSADAESLLGITPAGGLLAVMTAGFIVLHAQHAVNVLLVFGAICGVQYVFRRYRKWHPIAKQKPMYAQTALLAIFAGVWTGTHETASRAVQVTFINIVRADVGAASEVSQRSGSLVAIGAGLTNLFIMLFLVSSVFALLAAGYLLAANLNMIEVDREQSGFLAYVTVALVPLTGLFLVYFFGTPKMSFRQLGFIFVLITIVGAIATNRLTDWFEASMPSGRSVVAVVLVACLLFSLITVFPSPHIYKTSPGVSEQEMSGYETAFEHREAGVPFATMDSRAYRYGDAIYGSTGSAETDFVGEGEGALDTEAFNSGRLGAAYGADRFYVPVTDSDVETQINVYKQLNYDRDGLRALASSPNADRVMSNGEYRLYVVSDDAGA